MSSLWLPKRLAIIHCPGHQKGNSYESQGTRRVDHIAKEATLAATNLLINMLPKIPGHSAQDDKDFASLSNTKVKNGWRYTLDEELYHTNLTDQVLDL